jgi:hypothetical protein
MVSEIVGRKELRARTMRAVRPPERLRFMVLVPILLACSGCADDPARQTQPAVSGEYERLEMMLGGFLPLFPSLGQGEHWSVATYVKLGEREGMLEVCGYYIVPNSYSHRVVTRRVMRNERSSLWLGGSRVGGLDFLSENEADEPTPSAGCVKTAIAWDPALRANHVRLTGNARF